MNAGDAKQSGREHGDQKTFLQLNTDHNKKGNNNGNQQGNPIDLRHMRRDI